jgi:hypothetical protein
MEQVAGSMLAALLGAVAGALGAYLVGERARTKQIEIDEIKVLRLKIRAHQKAIGDASAEVSGLLALILKNLSHYEDIGKGMLDSNNKFRTTISMPQPYSHQIGIASGIWNINVARKWQSLETEIVLQNSNLNELNNYYSALRSNAHEVLLSGGNLNPQVIDMDNNVIQRGVKQQITANNSFFDRCLDLLAEMELGAEKWGKLDFTTIQLRDLKNYIERLVDFKPKDKALNNRIDKLRSVYTREKAFKIA